MQAPRLRLFGWAVASVLFAFSLSSVAAEPIPGRTVDSVRAWLIERNPELRAVGLEAEAAEARVYPAGALPDPSASLTLRGPDVPWQRGG